MDERYDLHCHSTFSDGTMTSSELLHLAKEKNLNGLSITDHDTIMAYDENLLKLAKDLNLLLIPGVEISSEYKNNNVHILGYNFDIKSKPLKAFLEKVLIQRDERNDEILKKLREKNINITFDELYKYAKEKKKISRSCVGRVHIAMLMLEKKYVDNFQQAFDLYIKDGAECYVQGFKNSPKEIIDILHKAGAKASLAHPYFLKKRKLIEGILDQGFDAIEVYYARLLLKDEKRYLEMAKKKNLLITGGSDYHGSIKPYLSLGSSWINEIELNKLLS
ncbi:MAG: 5'-3' exoribonuclease [Candidatus Anoxychlamydiales bacterium]|nr:5'-3' exoribonuclease [Candidatus Anoxychlamydiales bacterium]